MLKVSTAKSYQKCEAEFEEVETCDILTLYRLCLNTGRFKCSPLWVTDDEGEFQTTTAGGLWGAYLVTFGHFCKERASLKLAELRATTSVLPS